jgi:hypothetical protein
MTGMTPKNHTEVNVLFPWWFHSMAYAGQNKKEKKKLKNMALGEGDRPG